MKNEKSKNWGGRREPGEGKRIGRPKKTVKRKVTAFSIEPDMLARIDHEATRANISRSEVVNGILRLHYTSKKAEKPVQPLEGQLDLFKAVELLEKVEKLTQEGFESLEPEKDQLPSKPNNHKKYLEAVNVASTAQVSTFKANGNTKHSNPPDLALTAVLNDIQSGYGVEAIDCLLYAHKPEDLPCLKVWDKLTLSDQRFLIWQLVHTGRIDPEALPYKGIASRIAERLDQV